MPPIHYLKVQLITSEAYAPFGWVWGEPPTNPTPDMYVNGKNATFWHEHDLDPGDGGVTEYLWVHYRRRGFTVERLEMHRFTEQALIPLAGQPVVHVVCPPAPDPLAANPAPDLTQMQAFLLDGTRGVCMRRGCWHAHYPLTDPSTYLMITRRSTTLDLIRAKFNPADMTETVIRLMSELTHTVYELVL